MTLLQKIFVLRLCEGYTLGIHKSCHVQVKLKRSGANRREREHVMFSDLILLCSISLLVGKSTPCSNYVERMVPWYGGFWSFSKVLLGHLIRQTVCRETRRTKGQKFLDLIDMDLQCNLTSSIMSSTMPHCWQLWLGEYQNSKYKTQYQTWIRL